MELCHDLHFGNNFALVGTHVIASFEMERAPLTHFERLNHTKLELNLNLQLASLVGQGKRIVFICVQLRWWSLGPCYFGLILKFKPELKPIVIGLDMTSRSNFGLNLKIDVKQVEINLETKFHHLKHIKG